VKARHFLADSAAALLRPFGDLVIWILAGARRPAAACAPVGGWRVVCGGILLQSVFFAFRLRPGFRGQNEADFFRL
jgi:hypothetical protein